FGNTMAMALEFFPDNAGVAAGVIGVLQFGVGSIISSIALSFEDSTFFTISLSLVIISISSFLILRTYKA
ncbi:MAG: Bcr/CflA family drug resistance efflux transporter, partial [Sulfurospirillaceae bacterium]|nr:Bcr/CflA family drug resistance efflux transporter [Sulfurospirillaceae bacterium]